MNDIFFIFSFIVFFFNFYSSQCYTFITVFVMCRAKYLYYLIHKHEKTTRIHLPLCRQYEFYERLFPTTRLLHSFLHTNGNFLCLQMQVVCAYLICLILPVVLSMYADIRVIVEVLLLLLLYCCNTICHDLPCYPNIPDLLPANHCS